VKTWCALGWFVVLLAGCASHDDGVEVRNFTLRDEARGRGDDPMIRMEKQRRLLGAVSAEERRQRLGDYYSVKWRHADGGEAQGEVTVEFRYRQGATASRVKRMTRNFSAAATEGMAEFAVIGDDYFKNGRILAWEVLLKRGGRVVASERSYLWR